MFGIKLGNVDGRSSILPLKQEQSSLAESRYSVSKYSAGRRRSSRIKTASDWDFGDRPTIQSDATKTLYRPPPKNKNKKKRQFFPPCFVCPKDLFFAIQANVRFILCFCGLHIVASFHFCLEGFIIPSIPLSFPEVVIDRFSCCC